MYRDCYRAQFISEEIFNRIAALEPHLKALVEQNRIFTATVFSYDARNLFFYWESVSERLDVETVFPGLDPYLAIWPGDESPTYYHPLIEMYRSYEPLPEEQSAWRRGGTIKPRAMMSQMIPEKLSSYIFWHYQRQGEVPGRDGKFLSIWGDGSLGLLYGEADDRAVQNPHPAEFSTDNTPEDWGGLMIPHFVEFPDGKLYHYAEVLLTVS